MTSIEKRERDKKNGLVPSCLSSEGASFQALEKQDKGLYQRHRVRNKNKKS